MSYYDAPYARLGQGATAAPAANSNNAGPVPAANAQTYRPPAKQEPLEMPQLGATFVPGGLDDYYMPEVVAPAPQRVMPEVPQNMQDGLNRMELEAREVEPRRDSDAVSPPAQIRHEREPSLSTFLAKNNQGQAEQPMPQQQPTASAAQTFKPFQDTSTTSSLASKEQDLPTFSPFPKVKGDNVPPSDDEKEGILWTARNHVLHSNNINMQLSWARDTLTWVEIIMDALIRELNGKPRPPTPKVEHELRMDALNIVNYLASQDHPEALFMRSKWLEFGKFGYRVEKREAYQGYTRAAELGWGRAEYRMGMLYENSNDFAKAVEHYNKGLKMKDSAASYRLGMMSLLGQHGQKKDFQRGLELIQAAADTADEDAPQGAYVYGMLIARDLPDMSIPEGMLQYDLNLARMYIEKAAYLGFAKAQLKIGQAYELCQLGCEFNPAYSIHYYGLAAKQNQPEAALGVSRWFLFGYEGVFNKNESLAFKYAEEAATAKLATGEFAMGYYYEIGIHVEKNLREARNWYERAAENGNKDAVGRLESLNQSKTLTKADHETTALSRIKSQHGSMRGKRPDRFKQATAMPTLTESEADAPGNDAPLVPPKPAKVPTPKQSPNPSPRTQPTKAEETVDFPDPSRLSLGGARTPAFTVNIDGPAQRPKSTAPYPEDDRPRPLNISRPKSTAPYPEDDMKPHFGAVPRPQQGPLADRPTSAFGIRPPTGPGRDPSPMRQSQSMANLAPLPPAGADPRGRVASAGWEPQVPGAYRQASPGPARGEYRRDDYREDHVRPVSAQTYPPEQRYSAGPVLDNAGRNRLTKQNPYAGTPQGGLPQGGPGQPAALPGRDYGPRSSSRPASGEQRPMSENFDRYGRPMGAARPDRLDSLPSQQGHNRLPSQQQYRPVQLNDRPGRVESAPPGAMQQRPQPRPTHSPPASAPALGKKPSQGPATFEEMGIKQGKDNDDCVVM